ncbi:hypothetical protein BUALT_Bualt08G0075200 [Buddleja alternifolia]|uniref:Uncharacterized protein n=1 Tax=Buddleja alternifolia TaxID=168488 RepID=A0AAV6X5Q4_9LAMI|nr:hypothetical protein BUALT_Bualt08G0075200 [Buddleja alternifolia]
MGMAGDLFQDLPPPIAAAQSHPSSINNTLQESAPKPPPAPALKSALKRPKPPPEAGPEKRIRFKTTTDASEKQVIEAMQKITSHIKNPSKFNKASKLAIQLIQAGSIKEATSDYFFSVLEAAMLSMTTCNEPSLRDDYCALFSAAQDVADCLSKKQKNMLTAWTIRSIWANDLFTDDSFVFSKSTGRIKEAISSLPVATEDDDIEEAVALKGEITEVASADAEENKEEEPDPFGLDALISKDEKSKSKKEALSGSKKDDEEEKRFLKSQREALISCLEIAAKRYKTPWCQTAIDILAKHAFDNISRFTKHQRDAIQKLWASIREQQTRRKQGKSVSGKLDVNGFEWLQHKYSTEKISIRHSVGGSGDRRCQQWLG